MGAPSTTRQGREPRQSRQGRRLRVTRRGWIVFTMIPIAVAAAIVWPRFASPVVTLTGIIEGATYGPSTVPTGVSLSFDRPVEAVTASIDGSDLGVSIVDLSATLTLDSLGHGDHLLVAEVDRGSLAATVRIQRAFRVDLTGPLIEVLDPTGPVPPMEPLVVIASTDDLEAVATINGTTVAIAEDGSFSQSFERPPEAPVTISLTDAVGNVTEETLAVVLALPGSEGGPPVRGVHASGYTWASSELKDPIMEMIAAGLINTIEIDLKEEAGEIWYATDVPLAQTVGAVTELWDLAEVVDELHALGVRVIGRLVVFRDPKLAAHAVSTGAMDLVVQNPDGTAYGQYGGYTNPFNTEVWEYNIALAEEAARLGVDDILYDYVRRPDQFLDTMRFPGQGDAIPEDAIVGFLEESRGRINAAGARLGASVFGIAATRPDEIAQDIPRMAHVVDYVAPMVYPSHWGPGEYGVADPNSSPYDIAFRSLEDFQTQVAGTDATVMAWLQDFSLGVDYGPAEVRAQIQAAEDAGVLDFLLWDAAATYTRAALEP
ncbi:MAG: hypothetical protein JJE47_03200 [Acidimicrobiia bacterium]|nr:hypothetical protein [Acidimicrobiia bacterium]